MDTTVLLICPYTHVGYMNPNLHTKRLTMLFSFSIQFTYISITSSKCSLLSNIWYCSIYGPIHFCIIFTRKISNINKFRWLVNQIKCVKQDKIKSIVNICFWISNSSSKALFNRLFQINFVFHLNIFTIPSFFTKRLKQS